MATKVLVKNFHTTNVDPNDNASDNINTPPNLFRLKVNKYGFRLEDIRVEIFVNQKKVFVPSTRTSIEENTPKKITPGVFGDKVTVKITAVRYYKAPNERAETTTTREFEKLYDILARHQADPASMRYDLDPKNPMFFIVQFTSHAPVNPENAKNANNLIYVNLDDSSESLVESAAKSLVNVRNIDDLRKALEDPGSKTTRSLNEIFAPSVLSDLGQASRSTLTAINIVQPGSEGLAKDAKNPIVRADIDVPFSIRTASMNQFQVSDYKDNSRANHLNIRYRGTKLILDAVTSTSNNPSDNGATSSFTKELNMPKDTRLDQLEYKLDTNKHSIRIEAPHCP